MVIEFRYKNIGGCQDNACYGYIRIMQDGLIALSGFQGNAGWVYNVYAIWSLNSESFSDIYNG
jgi:hypothetical protein